MTNSTKILILTLTSFVMGTSQFVIVGILDQVARSVGISLAVAGQLVTVFALANAIGTPLVVMLTARLGTKVQLLIALGLTVIGTVLMFALPTISAMLIARAIMGVGTGMFVVTSYAVAAKLAEAGKQGSAMSNISLGFSVALVLGLPLGRVIAAVWNWTAVFQVIGALLIVATFCVIRWIPRDKPETSSPSRQLRLLLQPKIIASLLITLFMFISYSVVNTYVTPLLSALAHPDNQMMSLILFGLGLASLVGSKAGGKLADTLGVPSTLFGGIAVQLASLLVLTSLPLGGIPDIFLLMLWAIAAWACGPTLNFNLVSTAPHAASLLLSLNSTFVQLGFAIGAAIGGNAIESMPIGAVVWIGALAAAVALVGTTFVFVFRFRPRR
jgi:DHA1 family putative efflux transporter-like MFS transporter